MEWTEWVIAIVNIILVIFVFLQVKHTYRPILTTKILSRDKNVDDKPSVLEYGDLYSVVSNTSPNLASKIKVEYTFFRAGKKLLQIRRNLSYLSPNEASREPLAIGEIIKKYPENFEEHNEGNEYKKIPKDTLNLILEIQISYKFGLLPYKIQDSYKIEWGSLKNYPDFKDHPILNCWNIRDGQYVYKLNGR
jgi:hypothetical protein